MEELKERYELAMERIRQIPGERSEDCFFYKFAKLAIYMDEVSEMIEDGRYYNLSLEELQKINDRLYVFELEENYETSFENPAYAVAKAGEVKGQVIAALARSLSNTVRRIFTGELFFRLIVLELFLEIYGLANDDADAEEWKKAVYYYRHDYLFDFQKDSIHKTFCPEKDPIKKIFDRIDTNDLRGLYYFGRRVGEPELKTARFLNTMDQKDIDAMAYTYTNGYYKGFINQKIDFTKKKTVQIWYNIGFERVLKSAVKNFNAMGLECSMLVGSSSDNKQAAFDHKFDIALCLDKQFFDNYCSLTRKAYEEIKDVTRAHGGPAVFEVFGEKDFEPVAKKEACKLDKKQQALYAELGNQSILIRTEYLPGEERSFTIISYPVPDIGDNFEEVFADTVKVNTLDSELYKNIQQHLIDALDKGEYAVIKGMNGNTTDLRVSFHELNDPSKETNFENCLDDVNIPVGEVFTSPKLAGTTGVLNVAGDLFLRGLKFKNLKIELKDGFVTGYDCDNFEDEEENKKYIADNIMYNHDTLTIGEFAIGTNTTAYIMGIKRNIQNKLDILIAEKTGPHFAFGDTCYMHSEDHAVFNPDGKEIIARDNEHTLEFRKTDPSKAYYGCHTDVTIPYNELGEITVYCKDGSSVEVIKNGRFVLPGTEELNKPLDEYYK